MFDATVESLASLVPSDWRVEVARRSNDGGVLRVKSPDDVSGQLRVIVGRDLAPRNIAALAEPDETTIVSADWLSPRSRELLVEAGYGYVDLTGNVRVAASRPGIVIRADGAQRNPSPQPAPRLNIRGPRAWALLRTLAEVQPPYGVSELAGSISSDASYVSRLLTALDEELLISRVTRSPVEHVEWEAMLRQFTSSYSLLDSNETTNWMASAGPEQFLRDLSASKARDWVVTGSFAASELVSVAAPEIAVVYSDDPEGVATLTRLREVTRGGNVVIARPYDRIVFHRTWSRNKLIYAAPTQLAVDCLTGPGRMPAEGEALIDWLRKRAPQWQALSLARTADLP